MNSRLKYISLYRITVIVWMAVKFLLQIFWFHKTHRIWDQNTKDKWKGLLERQAWEYRRKAIELGGLLIKFGQFLSSRADLLPRSFIKELEGLVDRVESTPFQYSKQIIEQAWGGPIDEQLKSIDNTPVASASIGDVYRAVLHDGTPVAIKVQRYRVDEIFKVDFKALRMVFFIIGTFTRYGKKADLPALYKEVVTVITNELDFTLELSNGNHFKRRFKDFRSVYIPDYYKEISTKRVLVMEWIEGAKITDLAFMKRHHIHPEKVAKTLFDLCVEQFLFSGMFHSDPHPGNLMIRPDGTIVVIDFGMVGVMKQTEADSIRSMVQGFILEDYDRVIHALIEMDFLLADVDIERVKKLIKQTTDLYLDGGFGKLDANKMSDIMDELQSFIKEQPIQLPADYAFLGRATSIVVGVLMTIYPQVDLVDWGRPVLKRWMSGENSRASFYKEMISESAKPLLSLPRALVSYLEDGDKQREWQRTEQQKKLFHQFYLFYGMLAFLFMVAGAGSIMFAMVNETRFLLTIGIVLCGFGVVGMLVVGVSHIRMIKR
ncbi:AarF/UbiB family protein [Halobacillus shinanisalinarum]|uniref:AarF/UbiB family protein n=1 Tax=Halobacillus shinanisalinarum TaxID=2932258 RepID=A0ABY4H625_9BACI|nr:AarF/UbiB family protein [Halobacillus shinanisalinarum]UOQ95042.1 AarF/UbiB family protein [Halobacillus shinanisalinarum]